MEIQFNKRKCGEPVGSVAIERSHLFRFPLRLAEKLGIREKSRAEIYFDKKRRLIAFRFLNQSSDGTVAVRQPGHSTAVSTVGFLPQFGISLPGTKHYRCWAGKGGEIFIDISKPATPGRPVGRTA